MCIPDNQKPYIDQIGSQTNFISIPDAYHDYFIGSGNDESLVNLILEQLDNSNFDDKLIYGNPASNISNCDNTECTECVEAWYASDPTKLQYMC